MSDRDTIDAIPGTGNVFADLGLADPEDRLIKAKLAHAISAIVDQQRLSQTQAARILGTDQAKVSALMNGRLAGFSVERLLRFVVALDRDVTISVSPTAGDRPGRIELVEVG
jgi:predicted XRE-type DNA-binding protein